MTSLAVQHARHDLAVHLDEVSAVVVTRGNVDLRPVLDSLPFADVVVWDNSKSVADLAVYGRYHALELVSSPVVYVQDDDCTLALEAIRQLVEAYEPGRLACNMPRSRWDDYPDSCLVGWGAVFDRTLPRLAFDRYAAGVLDLLEFPGDVERLVRLPSEMLLDADVVFSTLTPHTKHDLGFEHLPWAEGPGRMYTSDPDHKRRRDATLELARRVRDARP